jgi:glutathione peroxidase-family protein
MYQQYRWNGFVVVGFPSNDFNQEPLEGDALRNFYAERGVTFPVFQKLHVNGEQAHPLFKWLKSQPNGGGLLTNELKWNYTLFLVSNKGAVKERFAPSKSPIAAASQAIQSAM